MQGHRGQLSTAAACKGCSGRPLFKHSNAQAGNLVRTPQVVLHLHSAGLRWTTPSVVCGG